MSETPTVPELLHIEAAAKRLALSRSTLYELIAAGEIKVIRVGRAVRVPAINGTSADSRDSWRPSHDRPARGRRSPAEPVFGGRLMYVSTDLTRMPPAVSVGRNPYDSDDEPLWHAEQAANGGVS